jgi:hypothetical protein
MTRPQVSACGLFLLLALAGCALRDRDASDYLYDNRAAALFYCDPAGGPGGRSPFVPRGGDIDACHDYVGGDWR